MPTTPLRPPVYAPLVGEDRKMTPEWARFFRDLATRIEALESDDA